MFTFPFYSISKYDYDEQGLSVIERLLQDLYKTYYILIGLVAAGLIVYGIDILYTHIIYQLHICRAYFYAFLYKDLSLL